MSISLGGAVLPFKEFTDGNALYAQNFQFTSRNLYDIFSEETRSLANDFSQYHLGSLHATFSTAPTFFKKSLPPEWRALTQHPLDNTAKGKFRDRFRFSIVPSSLAASLLSYNIHFTLNKEGVILPQMSLAFGHSFAVPLYQNISLHDYFTPIDINLHAFAATYLFAKSISPNVKVFAGYRYIYWNTEYRFGRANNLPTTIITAFNDSITRANVRNISQNLYYFIVGVTYLPILNNWEHTISVGVDAINRYFHFNLEVAHRYIAVGVAISPASVLIIRPYLRFQLSI